MCCRSNIYKKKKKLKRTAESAPLGLPLQNKLHIFFAVGCLTTLSVVRPYIIERQEDFKKQIM
jgi:hypothetical protein